jgi:hypothetical protein
MAVLRDALRTHLLADATLSAILSGGIFDAQQTDQEGPDTSWIPRAANGVHIAPFAILRFKGTSGKEIISNSKRRFVEIYFYDDFGYTQIERAKSRIESLLHRKQVQADDAGIAMFHWVMDRGELSAPEYENAASDMSRYYVDYTRR